MLRTAFGPAITGYLEAPDVVEVMLNPDGRLWIDQLAKGLADTGQHLKAADGERIIRLVAHHVGAEVHAGSPRVSAELPETGERFEGLLPPVVAAPAFAIRKPAVAVFTLEDYAAAGIMTLDEAAVLRDGGGGTLEHPGGRRHLERQDHADQCAARRGRQDADRVVLIEDTRELQCAAPNFVALRTKDGVASLSDLVRSSLRLRPDRIPIGEVRGREALDLLKAWGTGHPGGIGTIHAGSAIGALRRLEQLVQEAVITVPRALIAETINLIAVLVREGPQRRLAELTLVQGLSRGRRLSALPRRLHQPRVILMIRQTVRLRRAVAVALPATVATFALTSAAFAAGSSMPWEAPLQKILESVEGPVAKIIAVIIIVVTGLTLAFGDTSGGFRRLIQIVFGLSIAFAASSFFLSFFSFGGGALV